MKKVQLPRVEDEVRVELNVIKARRGDSTLSDTLSYLVRTEKENEELKNKIKELEGVVFELSSDLTNIKLGRTTLTEFNEDMKLLEDKNIKCTIKVKDIKKVEYDEEENGD
jgi:hypothetical protein